MESMESKESKRLLKEFEETEQHCHLTDYGYNPVSVEAVEDTWKVAFKAGVEFARQEK